MASDFSKLVENLYGRAWQVTGRGTGRPMHEHPELEFNLIGRGRGRYLVNERIYELRRGVLIWLFPDQKHQLFDRSPDFQMWVGLFRPAFVAATCDSERTHGLVESNPPGFMTRRLPDQDVDRLESLFMQLAEVEYDPPMHTHGMAFALLQSWRMWSSAAAAPGGRDVHPAVEKVAYELSEGNANMSVADLARMAGLSASRLSRVFKEDMGISVVSYRNRIFLDRFFVIYGHGRRWNIVQSALEAGFGSYPQFYRVFRQEMGQSPAQYARGIRAP